MATAEENVNPYGPAPLVPLERVEWRVDGKPAQGRDGPRARFVPYIDARDVAALLDQWVGPLNWRASFEETVIGGKTAMWGVVAVRDPRSGDWIEKRDIGVPSNFEPAKGLVSDAFKRAGCVQWGCGRNVYDLPSIWAPCRVTGEGDRAKAWPVEGTMPAIQAELKRQNFEATGGRATGADPTADPETGESPRADDQVSTAPPSPPAKKAPARPPAGPASNGAALKPTDPITEDQLAELEALRAQLDAQQRAKVANWAKGAGIELKPSTLHQLTQQQFAKVKRTLTSVAQTAAAPRKSAPGRKAAPQPPAEDPEVVERRRLRHDIMGRLALLGDEACAKASREIEECQGPPGPDWAAQVEDMPPTPEWDAWLVEMIERLETEAEAPFEGPAATPAEEAPADPLAEVDY